MCVHVFFQYVHAHIVIASGPHAMYLPFDANTVLTCVPSASVPFRGLNFIQLNLLVA